MPGGPLTLSGPATRADASAIRRDFRVWLTALADPDTADDLTLAVYEALANVVDHAYASARRRGEMRLWAAVSPPLSGGRDLVVTVSDDGSWRRAQAPGWRGRGLPLMHTLAHASVISGATGTVVQMRRRVAPVPALVPA
ncbi:ATP-binding protein [Actinomycetospora sp. TBRC 11914]|nr:ATP-binding protein [Actinomycetospora sp. TBRC 11914]